MISFDEALGIVRSKAQSFGTETIPLEEGIGRVLNEDWYCDRDLPPYDRVTMDGIALNFQGAQGKESLPIVGVIPAGSPKTRLTDPSTCFEIMTGATLPDGADTIIRYEDITVKDGHAMINAPFKKYQNIHWKGEDRKKDSLVLEAKTVLSSSEIGLGASIGKHHISVARLPKAIVISTGDELVEVNETPLPHQIRRGNVYRTTTKLRHLGLQADSDHLKDDKKEIELKMRTYLNEYDLIILSGGVSKGKFDFLPEVLSRCGVEKHFHRVAQRPGKPLWFGTHQDGATVFALPGNPISSFMCLHMYVLDWLWLSLGIIQSDQPYAVLAEQVFFKPNLTYFLEVSLTHDHNGLLRAIPRKGNGSGDLANLATADAFIKLPQGQDVFEAGSIYPVYAYR